MILSCQFFFGFLCGFFLQPLGGKMVMRSRLTYLSFPVFHISTSPWLDKTNVSQVYINLLSRLVVSKHISTMPLLFYLLLYISFKNTSTKIILYVILNLLLSKAIPIYNYYLTIASLAQYSLFCPYLFDGITFLIHDLLVHKDAELV